MRASRWVLREAGGETPPAYSLASADVVEIQGDTVCVVAVQSGVIIGPVG